MEQDRARWDRRHAGRPLAEPSAPDAFEENLDVRSLIPRVGRAVDVACGLGAQTLWMASSGLDVVALDVSPIAVEMTTRAAVASGLGSRVTARVHDLDEGLPDDLSAVDLIVCQRFRATALYAPFVERLAPGGMAIVTVLSAVGLDVDAGPFHASPGELIDAYRGAAVDVIHHSESAGQASIVVRRRPTRRVQPAPFERR